MNALALVAVALSVGQAPALSLTASPERLALAPGAEAVVRVQNSGARAVLLDAVQAAYTLDPRGRPQVGPSAHPWFRVRPSRIALAAGAVVVIRVDVLSAPSLAPGDHSGALLLATRSRAGVALPVRVRLGVVVVLRVPGRVHRKLTLGPLHAVGHGLSRRLALAVENTGDIDEWLDRTRITLSLHGPGRLHLRLQAVPRRFLARTQGVLEFRIPRRLHRGTRLRVELEWHSRTIVARQRAFWVRS